MFICIRNLSSSFCCLYLPRGAPAPPPKFLLPCWNAASLFIKGCERSAGSVGATTGLCWQLNSAPALAGGPEWRLIYPSIRQYVAHQWCNLGAGGRITSTRHTRIKEEDPLVTVDLRSCSFWSSSSMNTQGLPNPVLLGLSSAGFSVLPD